LYRIKDHAVKEDISSFQNCPDLRLLYASDNNIEDLIPLTTCMNLSVLTLNINIIQSVWIKIGRGLSFWCFWKLILLRERY